MIEASVDRRSVVRNLALVVSAGFLPGMPKSACQESGIKDPTFRTDVFLVLLDVSVKDDRGFFVPGLRKENFAVFEDGRPQTITVFDPEDRPVTVGVLLDESRSMTPKQPEVLAAARALIEESNRRDEIFVLHFNETVVSALPAGVSFSSDLQQLLASLSRVVPGGKTALYDALWEGLKHLRLGRWDKKTLNQRWRRYGKPA